MNGKPKSKARTFGWIVLLLVGLLMILQGLESAYVAYVSSKGGTDTHIVQLRPLGEEVVAAAQGRRGTAAATVAGLGLLYCMIAANAFRRGERWAWWTILLSALLASTLILLRIPLLNTQAGAMTALVFLVLTLVGVLVPVRDFFHD